MKPFIIEPMDPLVFGNGKPFTAIPGARNESLPLPPPSTVAGLVRTTAGRDADGWFDTRRIPELLGQQVMGPLLVRLTKLPSDKSTTPELALAAPADALRLEHQTNPAKHRIRRLVPLALGAGDQVSQPQLAPVGQPRPDRSKPPREAPAFWRLKELESWLSDPPAAGKDREIPATWGAQIPRAETRQHVAIGDSGTAESGALFSTTGRRFAGQVDGVPAELGLYCETQADLPLPVHCVLGGEGRLSRLRSCARLLPGAPPASVIASARAGHVRVYLLTPAPLGGSSWTPEWGTVLAQASGRPDVVSGWAHAPGDAQPSGYAAAANPPKWRRSGPKPIRRLLPAGSVFFVRLNPHGDQAQALITRLWGQSIVTGQDERDGFGRVLFGTWDGKLHMLDVSQ